MTQSNVTIEKFAEGTHADLMKIIYMPNDNPVVAVAKAMVPGRKVIENENGCLIIGREVSILLKYDTNGIEELAKQVGGDLTDVLSYGEYTPLFKLCRHIEQVVPAGTRLIGFDADGTMHPYDEEIGGEEVYKHNYLAYNRDGSNVIDVIAIENGDEYPVCELVIGKKNMLLVSYDLAAVIKFDHEQLAATSYKYEI